ncbi:Peptidoglycan/LPS O-acetylase OafA/YrhL, contains acyltransferase and SGNH-hydrolase domains [Agromyces sp. CF514]|uniref:acyltransferase family protein n=1 Tax=Agromyces sp. CF514 TaxID=1881031 RepID=UPI0008E81481|nr:acyltransferase [Agromyces sp. CF514]SFR85412.1 Peptidoglycan/LPS O-acetylase OafA/YrhL, contains acyltransferase and SGNH-hydrolase domains [Agromyces sp. CF514]
MRQAAPPRNNFSFVLVVASLLIVVRHSAILLGADAATGQLISPPFGVFALFAASGYLVVPSWQRRPKLGRYVTDRVARLLPGLFATVILTICIVGALATTLPLREYFSDPLTRRYLLNLLLNPQYSLPGVFVDNPVSSAVNGTLWSLPAQFAAYLAVPLVALLPSRWVRGIGWIAMAVVAAWGSGLESSSEVVFWGSQLSQWLTVLPCFFVGAAVRELMPKPHALIGPIGLVVVVMVAILAPQWSMVANWSLVPLATIAIGAAATPVLRDFGRWGTPSYGVFLVGFPVQQFLIAGFGIDHAWVSMVATVLISLLLAFASLRLVEAPALTFVHRWTRPSNAAPEPNRTVVPSAEADAEADADAGAGGAEAGAGPLAPTSHTPSMDDARSAAT